MHSHASSVEGVMHTTPSVTDNNEAWRYLSPFLLLICVVLLGVWWLISMPVTSPRSSITCQEGAEAYIIKSGDTCWAIAENRGISVELLQGMNKGLECEKLAVGQIVCIPL